MFITSFVVRLPTDNAEKTILEFIANSQKLQKGFVRVKIGADNRLRHKRYWSLLLIYIFGCFFWLFYFIELLLALVLY